MYVGCVLGMSCVVGVLRDECILGVCWVCVGCMLGVCWMCALLVNVTPTCVQGS